MTRKEEKPTSAIRRTLAGRSYLQFETMLLQDNWRAHITSAENVAGIARERDAALERLDRASWVLLGSIAFVLLYIAGIKVDLKLWGNDLQRFPFLLEASTLVSSMAYVRMIAEVMNFSMLGRYLLSIAKHVGEDSPALFIAPYSGRMVRMDGMAIRFTGFTSWPALFSVFFLSLFYFLPLIVTYTVAPAVVILYASWHASIVVGTIWIGQAAIILAVALTIGTVIQLLLFFVVPFKYKLRNIDPSRIGGKLRRAKTNPECR